VARLSRGAAFAGAVLGSSAVILAVISALAVGGASAVERVQDGGFDAATCTASDCTSPSWIETEAPPSVQNIGPICKAAVDNCDTQTSTHSTFPNWARLGAYNPFQQANTSAVIQQVQIPAAPATLRFQLRILPGSVVNSGDLTVTLDGATVFSATYQTPGYTNYVPVIVDVSSFAGGARLLRFTGHGDSVGVPPSFDIDGISLGAADLAPPPPPPPPLPTCAGKAATIADDDASQLLEGTAGDDVIVAGAGNDVVKSGGGNDAVCSGAGDDRLAGQGGNDKLFGEDGRDKLKGGGGSGDRCNGGPGKDRAAASCEKRKKI
jgi:hypothetical protein